jgi:long-chain fatty acid transport protein
LPAADQVRNGDHTEGLLDVGYAHIFVKEARTARNVYSSAAETTVVQTVRGKFETSVDYLSLQLNYSF